MTLLCMVVQNAHTTMGVFDGDELIAHWRVSTVSRRTPDEWAVLVTGLLERDLGTAAVDGVCVCSAVPAASTALRELLSARFASAHVVFVGPGVKSGLPVLTDNPREVGTDRVANALGALSRFGPPCIVVDFGTATTFDVVSEQGQYVGGAIAPGVQLSVEALGERAAQLRQVELAAPRSAIAKNTVEALQSGAVFGFAGQVDALVHRMRVELDVLDDSLSVVATGSLAGVVVDHCTSVTHHDPWLALEGLRVIHGRN